MARWGDALQLRETAAAPTDQQCFYLWYDGQRLRLCRADDRRGIYLRAASVAPRASFGGALARACGVTRARRPSVLDVMSGLGSDGMVLAALGCSVTLIEQHPALWALLDDYLHSQSVSKARALLADCWGWLAGQGGACCDTLYLDPFFPPRAKKALPGKAMQYLRELTGQPLFESEKLDLCLRSARERVVLKRRLRDPKLGQPAWQIKGRTVRYDVYRAIGVG